MNPSYHLVCADYVIIVLTFLISMAIGVKFQFSGNRQNTTNEYLLAGKNMSILPVVISITATMFSASSILGFPMETYRFGLKFTLVIISFVFGIILAAVIFTPVYFNCKVSTSYQFLEIRYGKSTKYIASGLFIIQMVLFMSVVLYSPVLALSAVTDLSIEASIVVFGLVCTFYCTLGGLKGVLWTDVFQACLMFMCIIPAYVYSVPEAGGVANVYQTALEGQRLIVLDFSLDFTKRFTFQNCVIRGIVAGMGVYGTSQLEVQRLLSLSTIKRAKSALYWSVLPVTLLCLMCSILGVVLFTIFKDCDPVLDKENTRITKYDQVLPYYIVTRLHSIPGLTGFCLAGIFSGSLSTFSSGLNSMATVTVLDFIKPLCKAGKLNDFRVVYIAKALSVLFGLVCICFAFVVSKVDSVVAINMTLLGITEGPILAIYLVGMLTRKGTQGCILFGLFVGLALTGWIGYGIAFSGYSSPSLPVKTSGCPSILNSSEIFQSLTTACEDLEQCPSAVKSVLHVHNDPFILYKVSFVWISPIGLFLTLFAIAMAFSFTGTWRHNVIPASSKCLSPVTRLWTKKALLQELSGTSVEQVALNTVREFERNMDLI